MGTPPEIVHGRLSSTDDVIPEPPLLIRASAIEMENAEYGWDPLVPLGSVTVAAGLGGLGKSHVMTWVAARATRGQLPGDLRGIPVGVVIATAEDALAYTMVPRLTAAGADLDRVSFVNVDTGFTVPDDLPALEAAMSSDVRIVVLDPVIAFIPTRLDSHKDQHARAALAPLAALAERHKAAVLCVMHLNKSTEGSALFLRVSSSVGFLNAARSAILIAEDPDDETVRVLAHGKANLSEPGESLRFRIEAEDVERSDGAIVKTSRIAWLGSSKHSTADLLRSDRRRDPRDAAEDWLLDQLGDEMVPVEILKTRAEEAGHTWRTLERAKAELGVESVHPEIPGPWFWAMPHVSREVAALGTSASVSAGDANTATFPPIGGGVADGPWPCECGARSPAGHAMECLRGVAERYGSGGNRIAGGSA